MNNPIDEDLSQALNNIHEATDMDMSVIAEEEGATAARVRTARAQETEHGLKTGDNAGSLLSDLFSTDNVEQEVAELKRKRKEHEARKKAEEDAKAAKARAEAERHIREEMERVEEMKARKAKMLAEMEKQRRIAEVGYDEEEVARQKAEEERRQREEEEAEAREIAENERMIAELKANQAELDAKNREREAKRIEEERIARRKRMTMISIIAAVVIVVGSGIGYYFATLKAPDFYTLRTNNYPTDTLILNEIASAGMTANALAMDNVIQEAPKDTTKRPKNPHGPKQPHDQYGIGKVTNVLGPDAIVH